MQYCTEEARKNVSVMRSPSYKHAVYHEDVCAARLDVGQPHSYGSLMGAYQTILQRYRASALQDAEEEEVGIGEEKECVEQACSELALRTRRWLAKGQWFHGTVGVVEEVYWMHESDLSAALDRGVAGVEFYGVKIRWREVDECHVLDVTRNCRDVILCYPWSFVWGLLNQVEKVSSHALLHSLPTKADLWKAWHHKVCLWLEQPARCFYPPYTIQVPRLQHDLEVIQEQVVFLDWPSLLTEQACPYPSGADLQHWLNRGPSSLGVSLSPSRFSSDFKPSQALPLGGQPPPQTGANRIASAEPFVLREYQVFRQTYDRFQKARMHVLDAIQEVRRTIPDVPMERLFPEHVRLLSYLGVIPMVPLAHL
jgi:hypothetical protein